MRERRALLIAMSGVRIHDPRLRALGLTLPGFVERGAVIASLPSLSLLTLAAHTPPHWQVEYLEVDALGEAEAGRITSGGYDLVAISSLSARIVEAYALADRIRATGTVVVLGGLHVSALPGEAMRHADAVVQGEGEAVWPELLGDLEAGRLRPLYSSFQRRPAYRLDDARVPRYDLLDVERYNRLTLQTTRGCPHDCHFCAASRLISPYQKKPIPQVRRELQAILDIWPAPFLELADDNTFVDPVWSRELVRLLRDARVRWFTETDITVADDDELLELLADSGCAQLLIGLETNDAGALRAIEPRGFKARRAADYAASVRKIQSYGISVNGCFIFGLDDDEESFTRTRAFVEESGLSEVQITLLTPFPGTELYRALAAQGRLLAPVFWERCTLFDVTFRPRRLSPEELAEQFSALMAELYGDEATGRRRARRIALRAGRGRATAPA